MSCVVLITFSFKSESPKLILIFLKDILPH